MSQCDNFNLSNILRFICVIFILNCTNYCDASKSSSGLSEHPVIIVISFDGFRFDYFNRAETPHLDALKATGASVPYMRNQFVTKTFPNHMSIATGLHTESHGVVDNWLFDPFYNKTLNESSPLFWNLDNTTLPLWTLNELAGNGRKSGVMMWPGSEHPYGSILPSKAVPWNDKTPFEVRIDGVIEWITDPEKPVNVVFMYFEEPDEVAHAFGPESIEVTELIEKLDNATGYLVKQLKKRDLFNEVNIVILSDHGFQQVKQQDMINISAIVDPSLYRRYGGTPVMQLLPQDGKLEFVYNALLNASLTQNFTVFRKSDLANETTWHYYANRRILPIVLVADLGFVFDDFAHNILDYNTRFNRTPSPFNVYGVHGYDNRVLPMHPFFLAHGPIFKKGFTGEPFENVDLFPMFCKILGIQTPPNNGTYRSVKQLLVTQGFAVGSPVGWAIGAGIIFGIMILLGIMSILASNRERRGRTFHPDGTEYRFINRRNSYDSTDENENGIQGGDPTESNGLLPIHHLQLQSGKEEYQALLLASSTEEV